MNSEGAQLMTDDIIQVGSTKLRIVLHRDDMEKKLKPVKKTNEKKAGNSHTPDLADKNSNENEKMENAGGPGVGRKDLPEAAAGGEDEKMEKKIAEGTEDGKPALAEKDGDEEKEMKDRKSEQKVIPEGERPEETTMKSLSPHASSDRPRSSGSPAAASMSADSRPDRPFEDGKERKDEESCIKEPIEQVETIAPTANWADDLPADAPKQEPLPIKPTSKTEKGKGDLKQEKESTNAKNEDEGLSKEELRKLGAPARRGLNWQRANLQTGQRAPDRDRRTMNRVLCHAMGVRRKAAPKPKPEDEEDAWDDI
eukprot:CAMPEP_0184480240 /NCGR_PEP_ID=MMETSP0113_2-20130426/1735_1 /TAXON_ID=91329 /ORGANISM="Norrisiella sphaerica, Strain BC52" /LENGTH=310 /DNA_ID=CAMNT_0026858591 /DNA_START=345 /DNA_END=1277 /DNA_ORIENTATION=+